MQKKNEFEIYIYRITYTNFSGIVHEFSAKQVQDFCYINNLKAVPEIYYGYAKNINPEIKHDENFSNNLLQYLSDIYLDKQCPLSKNKIPNEGIVIRIESFDLQVYKHKSFIFLKQETKLLDKQINNIEE